MVYSYRFSGSVVISLLLSVRARVDESRQSGYVLSCNWITQVSSSPFSLLFSGVLFADPDGVGGRWELFCQHHLTSAPPRVRGTGGGRISSTRF